MITRRTVLQAAALTPAVAILPQVAQAKPLDLPSTYQGIHEILDSFMERPGVRSYITDLTGRLLTDRVFPWTDFFEVRAHHYWLYGETFWSGPNTYHPSGVDVTRSTTGSPPVYKVFRGEVKDLSHVALRQSPYDLRGASALMPWFSELYMDPKFDLDSKHIWGPISEDIKTAKVAHACEEFRKVFRGA